MKRFAFIDVQNTETTTLKVLKFALDHEKLFSYLKDKWECEKIFFYPGIQHGDDTRGELFTKLTEHGAIVRPKYFSHTRMKTKPPPQIVRIAKLKLRREWKWATHGNAIVMLNLYRLQITYVQSSKNFGYDFEKNIQHIPICLTFFSLSRSKFDESLYKSYLKTVLLLIF